MSRTSVIVTGGAGFIGSNLVHYLAAARPDWKLVVFDALTYAGNLENLKELEDGRYEFVRGDVAEPDDVERQTPEDAVFHPLPAWLDEEKEWKALEKRFVDARPKA